MNQEDKYFIPKIGQFIEGFKYQTKQSLGFCVIDFSNPEKSTKPNMKDYWFDHVVPNLDPTVYPHTFMREDGTSWTIVNKSPMEDDFLERIKIMLENGQIRARE